MPVQGNSKWWGPFIVVWYAAGFVAFVFLLATGRLDAQAHSPEVESIAPSEHPPDVLAQRRATWDAGHRAAKYATVPACDETLDLPRWIMVCKVEGVADGEFRVAPVPQLKFTAQVFEELSEDDPPGFRCAVFDLDLAEARPRCLDIEPDDEE